ncbi:MAG: patatin-like phospholipase family protein [Mycobacteriales bacterium]|nr:patatin-like phospholipase family protein [Mycobacteriales bacterium]
MTTRALVLGGGGLAGIGWEIGVLAGLASAGVDVREADLLVGTSAGSAVASQLGRDASLEDVYAEQLLPPDGEIAVEFDIATIGMAFLAAMEGGPTQQELLARVGRMALDADTLHEADRLAVIAERLRSHDWPATRLLVTAVEATTGVFRAFSADDGVSLVQAVAASCAVPMVWPPVTIGASRWMDGGMRSSTNADLAAGHDRVLVVAPLTVPAGSPVGAGLEDEVADLESGGSQVVVVKGDTEALRAFGSNPLDPATRGPSARIGYAHGVRVADQVRTLWTP